MRVLWITPVLPSLLSGTSVRQLNLLRFIAADARCTVLSFLTEAERPFVQEAKGICAELHTVEVPRFEVGDRSRHRARVWRQALLDPLPRFARTYPMDRMDGRLSELMAGHAFDLVHAVSLYAAPLRVRYRELPGTLTAMDVETTKQWRTFVTERKPSLKAFALLEWGKLRRFERYWLRQFEALAAMSRVDAQELSRVVRNAPVVVVPNGVDTQRFAPPAGTQREAQRLLFIGNLGYAPNTQAIRRFCGRILPRIRQELPDVALDIVGPHAPAEVLALAQTPGVRIVGYADVRAYLWRSTASIVPLRVGSGTRLKILESLAAGCPVVSTTVGAEGLDLEPGREILIADDAQAFASALVTLFRDADLQRELARRGRERVCLEYDWRSIAPRLLDLFELASRKRER